MNQHTISKIMITVKLTVDSLEQNSIFFSIDLISIINGMSEIPKDDENHLDVYIHMEIS